MMKQLLKQIYNERRSNAFLWIELLLVFVVLWYIIDLVYVTLHIYYQPMGFNIENTYVLRMNRLTDKSTDFNPEVCPVIRKLNLSVSLKTVFHTMKGAVERVSVFRITTRFG